MGEDVRFRIAGARPQPRVDHRLIHEWRLPGGAPWTRFYRTRQGYLLRFPELADFEVSQQGDCVTSWAAPNVPDESVEQLYLNQVLPLALSRRGRLVFHASAVEIGGVAVAFMGASGMGKSTLAASFATHGCRFLTDDGLVLDESEGAVFVAPSHPSIRLWDDSREAVIGAAMQAAPAPHFTTKGRFLAGDDMAFCAERRPLGSIYLLADPPQDSLSIEGVPGREAWIELVKHSFLIDIGERALLAEHFERLSSLLNHARCFRMGFPRRYEELTRVREAIHAHSKLPGRA